MKWISRHKTLAIILSVLALIAVLFVASWQLQGDDGVVGRAARTVVAFAQRPIAALAEQAGEGIGSVFSDQALYAENRSLREQIAALNEELTRERLNREELSKLEALE